MGKWLNVLLVWMEWHKFKNEDVKIIIFDSDTIVKEKKYCQTH
jgi:hypothetical protein